MANIDKEILKEFVGESKGLIQKSLELLESIEGNFSQVQYLKTYAGNIDPVVTKAKGLVFLVDKDHSLHLIADYAALCKAVGSKAAQIQSNEDFYNICVGLLLDATEILNVLINNTEKPATELRKGMSDTFLDRLRWVSTQFREEGLKNKKKETMNQNEIDSLMKKLGI